MESSQSSSCSSSEPSSQRSSRCAARASATWLSGTPSENSKAAPACAQEGAFDLAAARAGSLGDDQQTSARVGGELAAAPDRAGRELGLGVGGGMEMDLGGRLALGSLAPLAPGVEEAALHGQNAVKTGQKQRRTLRWICLRAAESARAAGGWG